MSRARSKVKGVISGIGKIGGHMKKKGTSLLFGRINKHKEERRVWDEKEFRDKIDKMMGAKDEV